MEIWNSEVFVNSMWLMCSDDNVSFFERHFLIISSLFHDILVILLDYEKWPLDSVFMATHIHRVISACWFFKKYLSICLLTVSDFRSCIGVNYRLKKFRISLKTYPGLLFGTKHVYNSLGKEKYNWPLNNVGLRNTDPPRGWKSSYNL